MKAKLLMAASIYVLVNLAACSPSVAALPAVPTSGPTRSMTVTGTGEVYLTPDIAYINIGVRTQGQDIKEALAQNTLSAQKVRDDLTRLEVDQKDIQTTAFNIYQQNDYGPQGEITRTYYVTENSLYVTIRKLDKLGDILDTVVKSGANDINNISFDIQDKEKYTAEARQKAIENALTIAEEQARAAHVQLGQLITMNVYSSVVPAPSYSARAMQAPSGAAVPIATGQLLITVNADLTYEIK